MPTAVFSNPPIGTVGPAEATYMYTFMSYVGPTEAWFFGDAVSWQFRFSAFQCLERLEGDMQQTNLVE